MENKNKNPKFNEELVKKFLIIKEIESDNHSHAMLIKRLFINNLIAFSSIENCEKYPIITSVLLRDSKTWSNYKDGFRTQISYDFERGHFVVNVLSFSCDNFTGDRIRLSKIYKFAFTNTDILYDFKTIIIGAFENHVNKLVEQKELERLENLRKQITSELLEPKNDEN